MGIIGMCRHRCIKSTIQRRGSDSVIALEEEFETEIPDEEAEKITTVQQAINYVQSHVKA